MLSFLYHRAQSVCMCASTIVAVRHKCAHRGIHMHCSRSRKKREEKKAKFLELPIRDWMDFI